VSAAYAARIAAQRTAVAEEQQRLRDEQQSALGMPGVAEVDALQGRMVANVLGCGAVRPHPDMLAGVHVVAC
jgi:hypothetical protein